MQARAFICGCSGLRLASEEKRFFSRARPWGLILFARNVEDPAQVSALVSEFRDCVGWQAPVLIDQEGGRVQRLRPPHWRDFPPPARIGALYRQNRHAGLRAARLAARLIGGDLIRLGINVDCAPLLDLSFPETHAVIGDRAYCGDPQQVAALGRAACEGFLEAGVLPVITHIPGHGRACADSHLELPVVETDAASLRACDFEAFRLLADMPLAMTAHIVFTALDPDRPVTLSAGIIDQVIRREIGFDGLLMSDDVSMKALSGSISERCHGLFAAGCDMALHCNGDAAEMVEVAEASPPLGGMALARAERALALLNGGQQVDDAEDWAALQALLSEMAV
jgi:beta-N-acetylhexosaminidase